MILATTIMPAKRASLGSVDHKAIHLPAIGVRMDVWKV